jgi:hypothetical protein
MKGSKLIMVLLLLGAMGCRENEGELDFNADPVFDLEVLAIDHQPDHHQLLLRLQLLHYPGDMLRFGLTTVPEHQARLEYYTLAFKEDLFLLAGRDTISCLDSHFERLHMDSPYRDFILTFPKSSGETPTDLILIDRQYTGEALQLKLPVDAQ